MRTCPQCKQGQILLRHGMAAVKPGDYSLAGVQSKFNVKTCWIAECANDECDWTVAGDVRGAEFNSATGEFTGGHFLSDARLVPIAEVPIVGLED